MQNQVKVEESSLLVMQCTSTLQGDGTMAKKKKESALTKAKRELREFWKDHNRLFDEETEEAQTFFETDWVVKRPKELAMKVRRLSRKKSKKKTPGRRKRRPYRGFTYGDEGDYD
jgi:hypothetical protein